MIRFLLLPKLWIVLVLAMFLAFTHYKAFKGGKAAVQVLWDKDRAEITANALKDSEARRIKDQILTAANAKVTNDYLVQKKLRASDAATAAASLRDLQATISSPTGADTAALGGADDPRDRIIDQCASSLVALDGYAKGVASQATGLQSYARNVCITK